MTAAIGAIGVFIAYFWAVRAYNRRFPRRRFPPWRIVAFACGIACMAAALSPWMDDWSEHSFAVHMAQHMILMLAGPPLVLLGAPLLLIVAVPPAAAARRITSFADGPFGRAVFAPITGWLAFVSVLWAAHFTPLYETSLRIPAVHVIEHILFITAAFLFWSAVVQTGYAPRAVPYPARMLYLFLAIPQGAFLGLAIYAARGVLYAHYSQVHPTIAAALGDQQNAGAVMWIGGGLLMFLAFMCTAASWAASERAYSG